MARDKSRIKRICLKAEIVCQDNRWSVGELVANIAGDGSTSSQDPYNLEDSTFERRLDSRLPDSVQQQDSSREVFDELLSYWQSYPDLRFCQMVCNFHQQDEETDTDKYQDSPYSRPISELSNEELVEKIDESTLNIDFTNRYD